MAATRSMSRSSICFELFAGVGHAGQHPQEFADGSHLLDRLHLLEELLEREGVTLRDLVRHALCLVGIEGTFGLLDEREDITHIEDARRHPVGMEDLEISTFSPTEANMIGAPVASRTDRAAPPRASPSSLVRITRRPRPPSWNAAAVATASWPIIASIQEQFVGLDRVPDGRCLPHQFLRRCQPARGVDDDQIVR